tara:strand:- start:248 stop:487 length:240 start_codon:yes stop_codon:yes gene_type:complete
MDSSHLHSTNRHLSKLWYFFELGVSEPEKEKKSFLLVGVARANFLRFSIDKKSPPQSNECKVEFILVLDERVDCSKKQE